MSLKGGIFLFFCVFCFANPFWEMEKHRPRKVALECQEPAKVTLELKAKQGSLSQFHIKISDFHYLGEFFYGEALFVSFLYGNARGFTGRFLPPQFASSLAKKPSGWDGLDTQQMNHLQSGMPSVLPDNRVPSFLKNSFSPLAFEEMPASVREFFSESNLIPEKLPEKVLSSQMRGLATSGRLDLFLQSLGAISKKGVFPVVVAYEGRPSFGEVDPLWYQGKIKELYQKGWLILPFCMQKDCNRDFLHTMSFFTNGFFDLQSLQDWFAEFYSENRIDPFWIRLKFLQDSLKREAVMPIRHFQAILEKENPEVTLEWNFGLSQPAVGCRTVLSLRQGF